MSTGLLLNLSPVLFDDADVSVGVFPYKDHEQLKSLREAHGDTHVIRRNGDRIVCVPVLPEAPGLGESTATIRLKKDLPLCAALVRSALMKYLHELGRQILDYAPIKFVGRGAADDLLAASVPAGVSCPSWLSVRPLFEASVQVVYLDKTTPFVGLALNVRTVRLITLSCEALLQAGVPLRGLYVGRLARRGGALISPHLELVGRVKEIRDGTLLLEDARPGVEAVNTHDAFIEPRLEAFDRCVSHVFGSGAGAVKQALNSRLAALRTGPGRLERLRRVIGHLQGLRLQMVPGVPFRFDLFLAHGQTKDFPTLYQAPKTVYIFDSTGAKTDTVQARGLDTFGPYTAQTFTPSHPRVCVICQATRKGQVEQFLHKFLRGIPGNGRGIAPFAKGLIRKYAFEDISAEFFTVDSDTPEAYHRASLEAIEQQPRRNIKWDLALVEVDEQTHELSGSANPYLVTKATLLAHQIPVQEFEIETAGLADYQLGYALSNMALATYAKLGGIPWLIKANPTIAHELVVGLGSANVGEGRLGDRERVVGITTVFSGDGNYWLSNLSQAVPIADYGEALLRSLKGTIERVQRDMNWQPREHVRLVFHSFKPMKDAEAEAVRNLVLGLGDYDVEFAFLHVVKDHPFVLFDERQLGVKDPQRGTMKGVLAPDRGGFFRLSNHEILISLTGAREVKRPEDGLPRPILLRLHRASSFKDTTYLARQVFSFSGHSWRSFLPAPMPVTILYSELIAGMLGKLAAVPRWNPDMMLGRIGTTRWFL